MDSRHPQLFWCPDLFKYVKEVNPRKEVMLVLNKADYLPDELRLAWGRYFEKAGVNFVFWSAKAAIDELEAERREIFVDGLHELDRVVAVGEKVDPSEDPRFVGRRGRVMVMLAAC